MNSSSYPRCLECKSYYANDGCSYCFHDMIIIKPESHEHCSAFNEVKCGSPLAKELLLKWRREDYAKQNPGQ